MRFPWGGQDAVSSAESQGVEGHLPRHGGVLHQRNFIPGGADQARHTVIDAIKARSGLGSGFIAPDLGLAPQIVRHRLQHRQGHQAGAGVVEVDTVDNAGGFGAKAFKINGHGQSGIRL